MRLAWRVSRASDPATNSTPTSSAAISGKSTRWLYRLTTPDTPPPPPALAGADCGLSTALTRRSPTTAGVGQGLHASEEAGGGRPGAAKPPRDNAGAIRLA